jgi:hypothetical protein
MLYCTFFHTVFSFFCTKNDRDGRFVISRTVAERNPQPLPASLLSIRLLTSASYKEMNKFIVILREV